MLAYRDNFNELGRITVKIDHVAGFARRWRSGLHGDADIGLRERRRVICAVTAHGDELAFALLLADQRELVLGLGFRKEIIDAGFRRNSRRGERIVAGDHHRSDAHAP